MRKSDAVKWLRECANFMGKMERHSKEDSEIMAMRQNAVNCHKIADLLESHALVPREMPATLAMVEAWEDARPTPDDVVWARDNIPVPDDADERDADNLLHEAACARADYRAIVAQAEKEMEEGNA